MGRELRRGLFSKPFSENMLEVEYVEFYSLNVKLAESGVNMRRWKRKEIVKQNRNKELKSITKLQSNEFRGQLASL